MSNWSRGAPPKGILNDVDREIKALLWDGYTAREIANVTGVSTSAVYNVKQGRRAWHVPWPDGSKGHMPEYRAAYLAQTYRKGIPKSLQTKYAVMQEMELRGMETKSPSSSRKVTLLSEEQREAGNRAMDTIYNIRFNVVDQDTVPADVKEADDLRVEWVTAESVELTERLIATAKKLEEKYGG